MLGMGRGDEKNASDAIRNAAIIANNGNNIINDNNNNIYRISKCRMVRKLYICVYQSSYIVSGHVSRICTTLLRTTSKMT